MAGNFEAVRKEVSAEILRILSNSTICPRLIKRDFNKYWEESGRRIGSSLDIRRPLRVIGADGQALQPEGLVRVTVPADPGDLLLRTCSSVNPSSTTIGTGRSLARRKNAARPPWTNM